MMLFSDFMYHSDHNGDIKFFTVQQDLKTNKAEIFDLIDVEELALLKDDINPKILLDLICAMIDEIQCEGFDLKEYIKYFISDFYFTPIRTERQIDIEER